MESSVHLAEVEAAFKSDGFSMVRRALDATSLAAVRREWQSLPPAANSDTDLTRPAVMFWTHGATTAQVRRPLVEFPHVAALARHPTLVAISRHVLGSADVAGREVRLLEMMFLHKPPVAGHVMHWHQDASYSPFIPNRQLTFWIPLDAVDAGNGTVEYAASSHCGEITGMVDLHAGGSRRGETRPLIPERPEEAGYQVVPFVAEPGDFVVHHGRTWHRSSANRSTRPRLAVVVRHLVGENRYAPLPARPDDHVRKAGILPGEPVHGDAFPLVD